MKKLYSIPAELSKYKFFQHGISDHSSEKLHIMGWSSIKCRSHVNRSVGIPHLFVEGSSQWLLLRNMNFSCKHVHFDYNRLKFPIDISGIQYNLTIVGHETHNNVLLDRFMNVPTAYKPVKWHVANLVVNTLSAYSAKNIKIVLLVK